ncbi:MAG: carboxylesterase family protein [Rothia sp. (in: high G+C Gram-positive bacteria)]|nr:carboxylesterase family protein [Rothia sp. (in: high G+C Gram-positive bacteria)]
MRTFAAPAGNISVVEEGAVLRAQGIPYARAERFCVPQPVQLADFGDPYIADTPSPAAPQFLRGGGDDIRQSVLMSEECQNLSVVFPADIAEGEKLPVMVYFHGGSYIVGSGDGARYNPERLVIDERVVVVTVTFRLGLLGFLGGSQERPANLGLLDAREGLRWVKQNIASFGGDAENITVFGQSAGGDLVTQLMLAESVVDEGLLHRVISQSAPLNLVNRKSKLNAAMLKATASIPHDAPAEVFAERAWKMVVQNPIHDGLYAAMMPFGTQYGHYPLPAAEDVDRAWAAVAPRVDVLVGSNMRESAYFLPKPKKWWGQPGRKIIEALVRKGSHDMYIEPCRQFIARHRLAGGTGTQYILKVGNPLHYLYSSHCSELALLFENPMWVGDKLLAGAYPSERQEQGKALRGIWAEFARTGTVRKDLTAQARIEFR